VNLTGIEYFSTEQQTAKGFVKEITFVTASTNCNFLGYSVKFDDELQIHAFIKVNMPQPSALTCNDL
jgi:acyl-CoA thioesterase FadM